MITLVQARNYRNLRDVRAPLRDFQLLVGKNASGKSTFTDVIAFMSDYLSDGLEKAVETRSVDPRALVYQGKGDCFELAIEAAVSADVSEKPHGLDTVRYRLAVEVGDRPSECRVTAESLVLTTSTGYPSRSGNDTRALKTKTSGTALVAEGAGTVRPVVESAGDAVASFTPEPVAGDARTTHTTTVDHGTSALATLPENPEEFPATMWFRRYLLEEIHRIAFDIGVLARPNPPGSTKDFLPDGSNVASMLARFREDSPDSFLDWVDQLRLDAPDLADVSTAVRAEDGHAYLIFEHKGGVKVPAWLASNGLLHLAAYTLPTYVEHPSGTYLYEYPERNVYAGTMHSIYNALTCLWDSQALVATQSTSLMAFFKPKDLLCFARDDDGEIEVAWGPDHQYLRNWSGKIDVGTIVASGILG